MAECVYTRSTYRHHTRVDLGGIGKIAKSLGGNTGLRSTGLTAAERATYLRKYYTALLGDLDFLNYLDFVDSPIFPATLA